MADIENTQELTAEINDNFDTIKTLLNSIRAQGILNTSDVDKLLTGINTKLDKINTDEDIDLIKIFLSELKQTLDERHSVLISKFGAIESLFSNLLKNSNELPKSADLKEMFDIVATNLSVFSKEVVTQKDSLTDIALKIDALRSDDSQKKDIIKNITLLKPDLERLNNGFDSIVLSLNDNFKTIAKTISTIDKTEHLDKFGNSLSNIEMSSNTILSALQMLDKKAESTEETLQSLVTKDDLNETNKKLFEINAQGQELSVTLGDLSERYYRIDNLAEKIDASVNIIASLKSVLEDADDKNTQLVLEQLNNLQAEVVKISSDTKFEDFKASLESVLNSLTESSSVLDKNLNTSIDEIKNVITMIRSLDINVNFQEVLSSLQKTETELKLKVSESVDKLTTLNDANINRVLNDISTSADALNNRLSQTQGEIAGLCEKNFGSVFENIADLKSIVSQIDENSVSANNAIFSSITDRLTTFEGALRTSLENQERTVSESSGKLVDSIEDIKNVSNVLDYKMDSTVVENGNMKRSFEDLKSSVDAVLALDFPNVVKDLRVDLYASKQELMNTIENSDNNLSETFTNDLYGKYELLISKLDSVEDEIKKTQAESLADIKPILDNISSSVIDVLSYVSDSNKLNMDALDDKINSITNTVKETNMNYVESVRDIVNVIRVQVETNLKNIEEDFARNSENIKNSVNEIKTSFKQTFADASSKNVSEIIQSVNDEGLLLKNAIEENLVHNTENIENAAYQIKTSFKETFDEASSKNVNEIIQSVNSSISDSVQDAKSDIKNDIKYSYSKLLEIQDSYKEIKNILDINTVNSTDRFDGIIAEADKVKKEFEDNIITLRTALLNKISESKQELSDENVSRLEDIKYSVETFSGKNSKDITDLLDEIRELFKNFSTEGETSRAAALAKILDNFVALKEFAISLNDKYSEELADKVDELMNDFSSVKAILNKVDENVDGDMTRQLSIIESNFETLVSQITILFEKNDKSIADRINAEFADISERMNETVSQKLETYKQSIEDTFDNLQEKAQAQSEYLQERISNLNSALKSIWEDQAKDNYKQIEELAERLKSILETGLEVSSADYEVLKEKLNDFVQDVNVNNQNLIEDFKAQLDDITKYIDSVLDVQAQDITASQDALRQVLSDTSSSLIIKSDEVKELIEEDTAVSKTINADLTDLRRVVNERKEFLAEMKDSLSESLSLLQNTVSEVPVKEQALLEDYVNNLSEQIESQKQTVQNCRDILNDALKNQISILSSNIEKETDIIIGELVEQFDLIKKSQKDDVVALTSGLEEIISSQIYTNIEDLKSYLDIKTDSSVLSGKLDNLKNDMESSIENVISNISKMLEAGVFNSAISDFRLANEILINSAIDNLNDKIESFINENIKTIANILTDNGKKVDEKLNIFDKKFIDTVTDKFEEIKLLSNSQNEAFNTVQQGISDILADFGGVKNHIENELKSLRQTIFETSESSNVEIRKLNACFENLRSQISNKSFDEAFQASINKQISNLEDLVTEQLGYIEDINDLCSSNLPDVTELNTLVKASVITTLDDLKKEIESQDVAADIDASLKQVKSEIINQILNVFNQISFVAEQEEILDFVHEKHEELIGILSRIVNSTDAINSIKSEIKTINDKITSIISSEGDIDYIYSLQDLESDIANLRVVLNDINENNNNEELEELMHSTNAIYALVESIKTDLPSKSDIEGIAEDIVSISSRTNKLLLASDESYKDLHDNLQDFKLVINDLDERTRNFAKESGMDKVDAKLNALNAMMVNGAKTNQVFNQIFEYLAEWVDNASVQINSISDKINTLDEIEQIKSMLSDIKTASEDNTEGIEIAEALGTIFDKQIKKISGLETKLDKLIVDSKVNKKDKSDYSKLEGVLNKFLVAMDDKLSAQQDKINTLETKLENAMSLLGDQDTTQLTKKVGGMDRQIAKLNKSIEKIASHVVEK